MSDNSMELTVKDVAQILGVSIGTIRKWTDEGHLASRKTPGGHRRYSHDDIEEFLKKMRPSSR